MHIELFIVAALVSACLTPLARRLAFRLNLVSTPGGRHVHAQAIPRLGGLSIFIAVASAMIVLVLSGKLSTVLQASAVWKLLGLSIGASMMFAMGLADDMKGIRARYKLLVQIVAATTAFAFGFKIDLVSVPFLGDFSMGAFAFPVTLFWVVGIVNAINLIDGLDGLAAGVVFVAALTNFVVATVMDTPLVAMLMPPLAGAVLGFLFYNFNPARIFMGDAGSYFLGFVLALCSISGPLQKASAAVSIVVPIVALGVPIVDTMLAMLRRVLEKRSIFSPDRGHIHHRLIDMGITHRRAVLIIYAVSVAMSVGSIGIALGRSWQAGVAILAVSAVLIGLIRFIGYFEYLKTVARTNRGIRARHVEWMRKVILRVPATLERARTEDEVFDVFRWLSREARLDAVTLFHGTVEVKSWSGSDYQDLDVRDASIANYALGTHTLRFRWRSELQEVSPQMDILLQIVVDEVQQHLRRVGWPHVSAVPVPSSPRALGVAAHS
jgi:UDP-GlcNAc:undecaprenyl-phosphate/decaprenyl-phosphate GlcNAc-1-phosphate transferase